MARFDYQNSNSDSSDSACSTYKNDVAGGLLKAQQLSQQAVFAPYVETEIGAYSVMWDAWVVPNWKQGQQRRAIETSMLGLRPLGPTRFTQSFGISSVPVIQEQVPNFSSTSSTYSRIQTQHQLALQRSVSGDTDKDLFDGTLNGMNYRSVLGRGMGNTWELLLPCTWSAARDESDCELELQSLETIDIVFGYLTYPEKLDNNYSFADHHELAERFREVDDYFGANNESAASLLENSEKLYCDSPENKMNCIVDKYSRMLARKGTQQFLHSESENKRLLYEGFETSPIPRFAKLEILGSLVENLPGLNHLVSPDESASREELHNLFEPGNSESQKTMRHVFKKSLSETIALEDFESTPDTLAVSVLVKEIVNNEMMALPKKPSIVAPVELLRIWRELETIYGSSEKISVEKNQNTLLTEIKAIKVRLENTVKSLDAANKAMMGPKAVISRVIHDYEVIRTQQIFIDTLIEKLSDRSSIAVSIAELVNEVNSCVAEYARYDCHETWAGHMLKDEDLSAVFADGQIANGMREIVRTVEFDKNQFLDQNPNAVSPLPSGSNISTPELCSSSGTMSNVLAAGIAAQRADVDKSNLDNSCSLLGH